MPSTILTFVAAIDPQKRETLDGRLRDARAQMRALFASVPTMQFASLVAFDTPHFPPVLVFENNFDGSLDDHLQSVVSTCGLLLHQIYSCCQAYPGSMDFRADSLRSYLRARVVRPAAYHVGNVGRTRRRIQDETALHEYLATQIDRRMAAEGAPGSIDSAYGLVLDEMTAAGRFQWVNGPHARQTAAEKVRPWINLGLAAALLLVALAAALMRSLPWTIVIAIALVAVLRWHERNDQPMDPADLDAAHVKRLAAQEDHRVQNHLASITIVKPGIFRRLTLRVVLWAANLLARTSTNGTLSGIPSIHFAHWSLLDGGRRLLFLSNFDGSWENYLDDFIDKASRGLTGVWSNTVGFPRTKFLVNDGAKDGTAFKAFARSQQTPAAVWYSAYPDLTVQQIDALSTLREGLAARPAGPAMDEWLRCL